MIYVLLMLSGTCAGVFMGWWIFLGDGGRKGDHRVDELNSQLRKVQQESQHAKEDVDENIIEVTEAMKQARREAERQKDEANRAKHALRKLHEPAAGMASDGGQHRSEVERISHELGPESEAAEVVSVVSRLIEANGRMQEQLVAV